MTYSDYDVVKSELGALKKILHGLTEDDYIATMQIKRRIRDVEERLATLEQEPLSLSVPLIFRGDPVRGTRSIDADFATSAVNLFVDATNLVTASYLDSPLEGVGRIPDSAKTRGLRIAGQIRGSFGFRLELPPAENESLPHIESSDVHVEAVTDMLKVMHLAIESADEGADEDHAFELFELVGGMHARATNKMVEFFKLLNSRRATFASSFRGVEVKAKALSQVADAAHILSEARPEPQDSQVKGKLLGVLPESREFELRAGEQTIKGKLGRSIKDPYQWREEWFDKSALYEIREVKLKTKSRFTLVRALPDDS